MAGQPQSQPQSAPGQGNTHILHGNSAPVSVTFGLSLTATALQLNDFVPLVANKLFCAVNPLHVTQKESSCTKV